MLGEWEIDPARVLVVLRPPPDVSLYHRHSNPLFPLTLRHLGERDDVHAVVLPRTEEQREYVRSLALPRRHRVRGLSKKVLLRKAAEPLLPREVVHGRKRGFSIPAAAWLRGELEPFARATLSAGTLERQGFFRPEAVARLIDLHVARREDLSRQLWGLLAFTLWHERHVEGATRDVRLTEVVA